MQDAEAVLPGLQKNADDAFSKFYPVIKPYEFPRDYWYEYALTTMLKFVERKQTDTWKEVVNLYEEHMSRKTAEENARKTLEEARKQTEIAIQTRNLAIWTAAAAWRD